METVGNTSSSEQDCSVLPATASVEPGFAESCGILSIESLPPRLGDVSPFANQPDSSNVLVRRRFCLASWSHTPTVVVNVEADAPPRTLILVHWSVKAKPGDSQAVSGIAHCSL